jgi:hypothetical protein
MLLNYLNIKEENFEKNFPILLALLFKHEKKRSFPKYVKDIEEAIETKRVTWDRAFCYRAYHRNNFENYKEMTRDLHCDYRMAKMYYNSKYVKEDLLHLAIKRFDEIMVGIEFPSNIEFKYDYKETNSLYGDYRYFLGDVYISLYDTRTKIKSDSLSIIHVSQTYDAGYHSSPEWDCRYQNEQRIRHVVKQFLEDMK